MSRRRRQPGKLLPVLQQRRRVRSEINFSEAHRRSETCCDRLPTISHLQQLCRRSLRHPGALQRSCRIRVHSCLVSTHCSRTPIGARVPGVVSADLAKVRPLASIDCNILKPGVSDEMDSLSRVILHEWLHWQSAFAPIVGGPILDWNLGGPAVVVPPAGYGAIQCPRIKDNQWWREA
jgi:hypothetical protein